AAKLALGTGDAAEATGALEEAERQGRASLADVRRTVGLLAEDDDATTPPQPGAADLRKLVTQFQAAGLKLRYGVTGDLATVGPSTGLALFRIAQESLTNAAKHAPASDAELDVSVDQAEVRLTITSSPLASATANGDGKGLGIPGMR